MLDFFTKSLSKLFGTKSGRDLKLIQPILQTVLEAFPKYDSLSNDELRGKTAEFKTRITEYSAEERKQILLIQIFLSIYFVGRSFIRWFNRRQKV